MFNSGASFGRLSFGTPDQPAGARVKASRSSTGMDSGIYSSSAIEKKSDATADPPCIPVTCGLLYNAAAKGNFDSGKCIPYSDVQCGVVVVVGWVHTASSSMQDASATTHISFTLADGTSQNPLQIIFDEIQSENSVWLTERITSVAVAGRLVRIVGQPLTEDGELKLRGIHITAANPEEWGYFHSLSVLHVYLQSTKRFDKSLSEAVGAPLFDAQHRPPADENRSVTDNIELPVAFSNVADLCARHVVRFILDNRKADIGVQIDQITGGLQNKHTAKDIKAAVELLMECGDAFETLDGFYDVLAQH